MTLYLPRYFFVKYFVFFFFPLLAELFNSQAGIRDVKVVRHCSGLDAAVCAGKDDGLGLEWTATCSLAPSLCIPLMPG